MAASTLPTLQAKRSRSTECVRYGKQSRAPNRAFVGSDQFTDERRKGASMMSDEDLERVLSAIQTIEKFAGRLPEGDVEGHIRRSAHELTLASEQRRSVEATFERLTQAVRQLDEHNTTGRLRRDFENEAPLVARLLEAMQEQLVPALKRAGYQV
jgi:hypothetical protein